MAAVWPAAGAAFDLHRHHCRRDHRCIRHRLLVGGAARLNSMGAGRRRLLVIEGVSWALGLIAVGAYAAFQFGLDASTRHDLGRFATLQAIALEAGTPDQSLWSAARLRAWRRALDEAAPAPVAVLRI